MQKIVILTGAGISAESGLGTFRDEGGLWAQHRIEDVATPEGFARDPGLVHRFYNARRAQAAEARPNAAHAALARLQAGHPGEVVIVTQNVDALHEAAGARDVIHMHGELARALCAVCDKRWPSAYQMSPADTCPSCAAKACRPDVVWFGEIPYRMDEILTHLEGAEVFAAIGTSGQVYPAAGFAQDAAANGAHCVEINLEQSAASRDFAEARPNAAHAALARLQAGHPGEVVIVTQNVDALHEAAGARDVIHMHGELVRALCAVCDKRWPSAHQMSPADTCPSCAAKACRPDVVWFGEIPYRMDEILTHLEGAEVFAAIGTSGQVYPAAGFAQDAAANGAHCVEINLEQSAASRDFTEVRQGRASEVVPVWVDEILSGQEPGPLT